MMEALAADFVITMTGEIHAPGWVSFTADGVIHEVASGVPPRELRVRRGGEGSMICPAFVSAHSHLSLGELRSFGHSLPFWEWIHALYPTLQNKDEASFQKGADRSVSELVRSGVSTVGDNAYATFGVDSLVASGARGVFFHEVFGSLSEDLDAYIEEVDLQLASLPKTRGEVAYGVSPHTPWTCPPEVMTRVCRWARSGGRRISLHLEESIEERRFFLEGKGPLHDVMESRGALGRYRLGASPTAILGALGVLGPDVVAAHCVQVDSSDIEILAESGTHVCHCPTSNLKLAEGFAPIAEMMEAGINVALGVDGLASSSRLDFFQEMRSAVLMQRGRLRRCARPSAAEALAMATVNGARALGLEDRVGTLAEGRWADLLLLEPDPIRHLPIENPIDTVVFVGEPAMVSLVMAGGRVLYDRSGKRAG